MPPYKTKHENSVRSIAADVDAALRSFDDKESME
jgi:hypothetical protein